MQADTLHPEFTTSDGFTISTDPRERVCIRFPGGGPLRATGRRLTASDIGRPDAFAAEIDAARRLLPALPAVTDRSDPDAPVIRNTDDEVDERCGLTELVMTAELAAALADGKLIEIGIQQEFTLVIRQAPAVNE